jgi:rubrerythrin
MIEIEALKMALAKEQDAVKAYQGLLAQHPTLSELLSFLVTEEQKHVVMIEKKISELSGY